MKYLKYLKYVLVHKYFVLIGCLKIGYGTFWFWPLLYRGIIHDMSKLRPSEFFPYVEHFYGNNGNKNRDDAKTGYNDLGKNGRFDRAWLYHQNRNKHHYQYWVSFNSNGEPKCVDIPDVYLLEMVADWYGAGRTISGRKLVMPWYEQNIYKIKLNIHNRNMLETVIKHLDLKG